MNDFRRRLKGSDLNWSPGKDISKINLTELMKQILIVTNLYVVGTLFLLILYSTEIQIHVMPEALIMILLNILLLLMLIYEKIAHRFYLLLYTYSALIPTMYLLFILTRYISNISLRYEYLLIYLCLFIASYIFYHFYNMNKPINKVVIIILVLCFPTVSRFAYFSSEFNGLTIVMYIMTIYCIYNFHLLRYATKEVTKSKT